VADFRDTPKSSTSSESSGFANGLLLFAACCAAAVLAWPYIKGAFPDSFPQETSGSGAERFDQYRYKGDPGRFDRWNNRGGEQEFSQYFPGDRTVRRPQERRLGPAEQYAVEDRRGERTAWRALRIRIDPAEQGQIEDRRSQRGGYGGERRWPDLGTDAGGGDIGNARADAHYGDGSIGPNSMLGWDTQLNRPAPHELCDRAAGGRQRFTGADDNQPRRGSNNADAECAGGYCYPKDGGELAETRNSQTVLCRNGEGRVMPYAWCRQHHVPLQPYERQGGRR
jgi:hypothetical protein